MSNGQSLEDTIAYYPFNGNAYDISNNGNHGIIKGAVLSTDRMGNENSAYSFDGTNSIEIVSPDYLPFIGDFTFSFWFKHKSNLRSHPISIGNISSNNFEWDIERKDKVWIYWNGQGNPGIVMDTEFPLNDNSWHQLLLTRKDSILSLYIDGFTKSSQIYKDSIGVKANIIIGGRESLGFEGSIDDILVLNYSRANVLFDSQELGNQVVGSDSINMQFQHDLFFTYPVENEELIADHNCEIKWVSGNSTDNIQLELFLESDSTWQSISEPLSGASKSYQWVVPDDINSNSRLRIIDANTRGVLALSDSFFIRPQQIKLGYEWEKIKDHAEFNPRDGAGALVLNDTIFLLGGWNPAIYPDQTNSEVWYSMNGIDWQLLTEANWEKRHTAGWQVFEDKLWVLGGDINQGHYQNDIWNSSDGYSWTRILDTVQWKNRVLHNNASFLGKMWVMGGLQIKLGALQEDSVFNDVWSSSDGVLWTKMTDHAAWSGRGMMGGSVIFNNKIWIMGGGTYNYPRLFYNDVWNSEDGVSWNEALNQSPWRPRQYHRTIVFDDKIWVISGYGNNYKNLNDVWYSDDGVNWEELKDTPWGERHAASSFVFDNSLWIIGGSQKRTGGYIGNDIWRLKKSFKVDLNQNTDVYKVDGDTVQLKTKYVENISYQWFENNSLMLNDTLSYLNINSSGKYHLMVSDNNNSGYSDTIGVYFAKKAELNFSGDTILNYNAKSLLIADGPSHFNYIWYKNDSVIHTNTNQHLVDSEGKYFVESYFYDQYLGKSETANILYKPFVELNQSQDTLLIYADSLFLNTPFFNSYQYHWYVNNNLIENNSNQLIVRSPGNYFVKVTNSNNITDFSDTVQIDFYDFRLNRQNDTTLAYGESLYLEVDQLDFTNYKWYRNNEIISDERNHYFLLNNDGTYFAEIHDQNEPLNQRRSNSIYVQKKPRREDIFYIYENSLRIDNQSEWEGEVNLKIYDLNGKELNSFELYIRSMEFIEVPIGNLSQKAFILFSTAENKNFNMTLKFYKK